MKHALEFQDAELVGVINTDVDICVIVNTFNHSEFIEKCLDSILIQDLDSTMKIVVHDDNSTDGTREKLIDYQRTNPETILLILENTNQYNQGISNHAMLIPWIESKYIALCEGDDFWTSSSKLQKQKAILASDSQVSLVYHAVSIEQDSEETEYGTSMAYVNFPHDQRSLGRGNFISTCSVMFRNRVVKPNVFKGIYNLLPVDWIIFAALADVGKVSFIPEVMATYRVHQSSSWSSKSADWRAKKCREVHWYIAGLLPGEIGDEARAALAKGQSDKGISGILLVLFGRFKSVLNRLRNL